MDALNFGLNMAFKAAFAPEEVEIMSLCGAVGNEIEEKAREIGTRVILDPLVRLAHVNGPTLHAIEQSVNTLGTVLIDFACGNPASGYWAALRPTVMCSIGCGAELSLSCGTTQALDHTRTSQAGRVSTTLNGSYDGRK